MLIRQLLLTEHSRANVNKVTAIVVEDPDRLVELMACFLSDEIVVAQRAAQAVGDIGRRKPDWLLPWADELVNVIEDPIHNALRRSGVRYFSEVAAAIPGDEPIPPPLVVRLIDLCSAFVTDEKTEVAVAAFAMQFVADRADKFPKHAKKLCRDLKKRMPNASPGFKNRGKKVLAKLGAT